LLFVGGIATRKQQIRNIIRKDTKPSPLAIPLLLLWRFLLIDPGKKRHALIG
jgi:hypothetical protein